MKTVLAVCCFFAAVSFLHPTAHATDFVFSSFQCDPSSCVELTLPTTTGSAFVSYNATCTAGVPSIEGSALAKVGDPEPCPRPYVAKALIEQSMTTQLDDFGCPYNLSIVTQTAQILTPFLVVVFNDQLTVDCQGGITGPTLNGTKPC